MLLIRYHNLCSSPVMWLGIVVMVASDKGVIGEEGPNRSSHEYSGGKQKARIDTSENGKRSGPMGLNLQIASIGRQTRDRIVVRIEVRNIGKDAFVWDREFSAFCGWRVTTDSLDMLRPSTVRIVDRNATGRPESRFVTVVPGQSLSKEIELTASFRRFVYGSGVIIGDKGRAQIVPNGYEEVARFAVPSDAKSVGVEAEYEGVPLGEAAASFTSVFGVSPFKQGLPRSAVLSNQIQIPLVAKAPLARPSAGTVTKDRGGAGASNDAP